MSDLSQQRCFNHASREAAARCPACGRCFCRECVTEHGDRVICATCLRKPAGGGEKRRLRSAALLLRSALGFMVLWALIYHIGQVLLRIPSSVHEGTLWMKGGP
ncbi:MAG: rhomboid family protein [Verrucomicrobiota bacterium]|nr:rhomboid family protein [Verrucomicrobiota bacterium]